jgi:hypothetical protein
LIPLAPTMATATCSWSVSTFISTRPPAVREISAGPGFGGASRGPGTGARASISIVWQQGIPVGQSRLSQGVQRSQQHGPMGSPCGRPLRHPDALQLIKYIHLTDRAS